uniref:Uncharacterized protein n=1 Tax=Glossina austeni TaxID=7395 RepID=A0A1A9VPC9_GLOAU
MNIFYGFMSHAKCNDLIDRMFLSERFRGHGTLYAGFIFMAPRDSFLIAHSLANGRSVIEKVAFSIPLGFYDGLSTRRQMHPEKAKSSLTKTGSRVLLSFNWIDAVCLPRVPLTAHVVLLSFDGIDAACTPCVPLTAHVLISTANVITPHNTINQSLDFNILV